MLKKIKPYGKKMNGIKKILYDIGSNPTPFLFGWLSGITGVILALLILRIF